MGRFYGTDRSDDITDDPVVTQYAKIACGVADKPFAGHQTDNCGGRCGWPLGVGIGFATQDAATAQSRIYGAARPHWRGANGFAGVDGRYGHKSHRIAADRPFGRRGVVDEATEAAGEHTAQILDESKQVNLLIASSPRPTLRSKNAKQPSKSFAKFNPPLSKG